VIRHFRQTIPHHIAALTLAIVYFLFQVEPFEWEYEANHRRKAETETFAQPSITWESFDKDNAPEAFVVDPGLAIEILEFALPEQDILDPLSSPYQPVRDKSPPFLS